MGRPSSYTAEIGERICARIMAGDSVRTICLDDAMPAESTVYLWLARHEPFSEQYARAKEFQAERFAEELIDIADDGTNDWVDRRREDGSVDQVIDHEHIARSKLRVETRKWLMGKMKPKKYGELLKLGNADGSNLSISATILEERKRRAAARNG